MDSIQEKPTGVQSSANKTTNALGHPLCNPDKTKDLELVATKLSPELSLDICLSFKKIKEFLRAGRVKLFKLLMEHNGKEYEALKSLRNNNETYVETEIDAQKINEMKKELADDLDSIISGPPRLL